MPSWAPRPSQILKISLLMSLLFSAWVALGLFLARLPFFTSWIYDYAQDHILPGCSLRKQPVFHFIDHRVGRVVWEGRCPDTESKLFYRKKDHFDTADNYEYNALSGRRHLFAATINIDDSVLDYYLVYNGRKTKNFLLNMPPETLQKGEFRISLLGDSQLGVEMFRRNLKTIKEHRPAMIMHLGDMVQHAKNLREWYTLFFAPITIASHIPLVCVSGNHDWFSNRPNFYFHDRPKTYFAMTIANSRFVILDSERETINQTQWLEQELQASQKASFRIVLLHVPPYIEFWSVKDWKDGDSSWPLFVRKNWVPLFKKFNVDLVISGHQHNYQRGFREGIHYVISGGAGSKLDEERVEDFGMYKVTALKHHFILLDLASEYIKLSALTPQNLLIDEFRLERKLVKKYSPEKDK